jgi:hypothetical protein
MSEGKHELTGDPQRGTLLLLSLSIYLSLTLVYALKEGRCPTEAIYNNKEGVRKPHDTRK